jgi:imidazole glycerol-phosphate synthase subunit HisH
LGPLIGIIDYGLGNINSVRNVVEHVGGSCRIIKTASELDGVTQLILPGVGAFDHGMAGLRQRGFVDALNDLVMGSGLPVLGICLGMQLMCRSSEEGQSQGLGWVDAHVRRIPPSELPALKVPHMGWKSVTLRAKCALFQPHDATHRFYFVHSYHAVCVSPDDIVATVVHGREMTAAFRHGNVFGVQFHPEKSHRFGKALIKRFVSLELPCGA